MGLKLLVHAYLPMPIPMSTTYMYVGWIAYGLDATLLLARAAEISRPDDDVW